MFKREMIEPDDKKIEIEMKEKKYVLRFNRTLLRDI